MSGEGLSGAACPRCGARGRDGAPWCSQCYLDLRPAAPLAPIAPRRVAEQPPAVALPDPGAAVARPDPGAAVARPDPGAASAHSADGSDKTWPCTACGTANPLDLGACRQCGAGFLAELHQQAVPLLVLPVVGDVVALRPAQRLALAGVVIAIVAVLTFALGVLL